MPERRSHTAKSTIDPYDGITVTLEDINTKRIASTLHIALKSLRLSTHRADSGRLWWEVSAKRPSSSLIHCRQALTLVSSFILPPCPPGYASS